jgi:integrase
MAADRSDGVGFGVVDAEWQRREELMERVRHAVRARHFSRRTERAHSGWVGRFLEFHGGKSMGALGEPEVAAFLTSLAVDGDVSASTQNQALSAILFLYRQVLGLQLEWLVDVVRAKRPLRLPVVFSRDEVARLLGNLEGTTRLVASLLYGSGLRLMEGLSLRVQDVDFERRQLLVRDGKGHKDRVTMLPGGLIEPLRRHLVVVTEQHRLDQGQPRILVAVPTAVARNTRTPSRKSRGGGCFLLRGRTAMG